MTDELDKAIAAIMANPADSKESDWRTRLLTAKHGGILGLVANALIALRRCPEWHDVLHFNESTLDTVAKAAPPFGRIFKLPFIWADEHDVLTAEWLQHQHIRVCKEIAGQAIQVAAREHSFHPIRTYLDSLGWDGIGRIDDWLTLYLGVDSNDYIRAVGAKFLISAVARIYSPGCKVDTCPIFEGPQGSLKSTALRTLAGDDFFSDDIAELGSKDSVMQTRGAWIIELAELDCMTRGEVSRVKAFMSRPMDRIRPPYGRRVVPMPRECVFAGTVNHGSYLKDETGGRRFWPVPVGKIKIVELQRDRDQLWAEARARYKAGERWWLDTKTLVEYAAEETEARYEGDPWDEKIAPWIATRESVSVAEVLGECLGKVQDAWSQIDQNRVARILRASGWIRKREPKGECGVRPWRYWRGPKAG